jgi:hypothetical protein
MSSAANTVISTNAEAISALASRKAELLKQIAAVNAQIKAESKAEQVEKNDDAISSAEEEEEEEVVWHTEEPKTEKSEPKVKSCRFFLSQKGCFNGDACVFFHDQVAKDAKKQQMMEKFGLKECLECEKLCKGDYCKECTAKYNQDQLNEYYAGNASDYKKCRGTKCDEPTLYKFCKECNDIMKEYRAPVRAHASQ